MRKRSRLAAVAVALACQTACASVGAQRDEIKSECEVTAQSLASVRYKVDAAVPRDVEVQCARCDDLYVAAQHEWLRQAFPGRMWVEHYSANSTQQPHRHENDQSCFRIPNDAGQIQTVCFRNSGLCDAGK